MNRRQAIRGALGGAILGVSGCLGGWDTPPEVEWDVSRRGGSGDGGNFLTFTHAGGSTIDLTTASLDTEYTGDRGSGFGSRSDNLLQDELTVGDEVIVEPSGLGTRFESGEEIRLLWTDDEDAEPTVIAAYEWGEPTD
ncbi:hypothetical protein OB905_10655 [Halobacteria archaeon AArc-dxtr1]|nr:hypothetical protein [Halobacteria archaeon AArc-dxtr1]